MYPRSLNPSNWLTHIHPEDVSEVSKLWSQVLRGPLQIQCEFRWVTTAEDGHSSEELIKWCSMAVAPEMDDEENVIRVFGAIVDVSDRKHAESEQRKRLDEALEMRRQQESFIDMTSHEVTPIPPLSPPALFDSDVRCAIRCLRYYNLRTQFYNVLFWQRVNYRRHQYRLNLMMRWMRLRRSCFAQIIKSGLSTIH